MITRATYGSFYQVGSLMQSAAARLQQSQLDAMSLDRLDRVSEHPADASEAIKLDAELDSHLALIDRLQTTQSELVSADNALGEASSLMTSAIEVAVAMATESYGDQDRSAAAEQIAGTLEDLVSLANTSFGGVYIFAGNAITTEPFDADGVYQGSTTAREVPLLEDDTLAIGYTGDEIFNVAGVNPFEALTQLKDALELNDPDLVQAALDPLQDAHDHLIDMRAGYGVAAARVDDLVRVSEDATLTLEGFLGSLKELDPIEAFSKLADAQTVYQAAATTLAQVLQTNIFQYL